MDRTSTSVTKPHTCDLCLYPPWVTDDGEGSTLRDSSKQVIFGSRYNELQASSSLGCPGCTLFKVMLDFYTNDPASHEQPRIWFYRNIIGYFHISIVPKLGRFRGFNLDIFELPDTAHLPHLKNARLIPSRTDVESNVENIKNWLRNCEEMHERCKKSSGYLPLRLLEIRGTGNLVRLIETNALSTEDVASIEGSKLTLCMPQASLPSTRRICGCECLQYVLSIKP